MNPFVADPDWGWWIILYFYLGGIAAGAYFTATLVDLIGGEANREVARVGYWIAFPLVALCGLFLTVDLGQPLRFWHMLFKSEVVHQALDEGWPWTGASWALMVQAPLLKYWSPMSVGSWALLVFGACSGLTFLGSLWPGGRLARVFRHGLFAHVLRIIGCIVGFFVAAYTGALLTATSQPIWSDTTWIAPLFLTSAASTGIAFMILVADYGTRTPAESFHRLKRADLWVLGLEAVTFLVFLASLGSALLPLLSTWPGMVLVAGTAVVGLLIPAALHLQIIPAGARGALAASVCALVGGFFLRYGIVSAPPALLARGPAALLEDRVYFSPEEGRRPGQSRGADPLNRPDPADPAHLEPRSKVFDK